MPTPLRMRADAQPDPAIADVSALLRCGLKGPGAAEWLAAHDMPVPERANSWVPTQRGGLVARLGRSEFLIESAWNDTQALDLAHALRTPAAGVYPVPRQDCALLLRGGRMRELWLQTCNVNINDIPAPNREVTLTSMVGVSVTILEQPLGKDSCHRIWCDGTFGAYLWETLLEVAGDLGGGAAGFAEVFPDAATLPAMAP
jgi:sarcosine oxidase subunit gamma